MTDAAAYCRVASGNDTILGVLPGAGADARTVVVLRRSAAGDTTVRLRSESFSGDVGWFVQGSVDLPPGQLGTLRDLLGAAGAVAGRQHAPPRAVLPFRDAATTRRSAAAAGEFPPTVPFPLRVAG